jgi:pimeloyl-ACP methyl ester carboxylesterase
MFNTQRIDGPARRAYRNFASTSIVALGLTCAGLATAHSITVGSVTLTPCQSEYNGYCGSITQPLDRSGHIHDKITIGFEFYPHTDFSKPPLGVILAEEGGPGFSTTGSRDGYVRLFDPLRDRRDILLIDKRGTGLSSAINCPDLQNAYDPSQKDIQECAKQLGAKAWLYGSPEAADDIAAVLAALKLGPVDYYGDSYGTWFGEVLATRHPEVLRTMVLDSAYPVLNDDSDTELTGAPHQMDLVCERSAPCASLGSSASARFHALLESLRTSPVSGTAPGEDGEPLFVVADPRALVLIVANAGNAPTTWRDLDAAGRAWLDSRDSLPLLRLVAEARDSYSGGDDYTDFSVGLQWAVQCADYGANFDFYKPYSVRLAEYNADLAQTRANDPDEFTPFTIDDVVYSQMNAEDYGSCLTWPPPAFGVIPGQPVPANATFPRTPVLVLSGELDTVTSPSEGAATAALFPSATFIETTNMVHESAIGDEGYFIPPNGQDLSQCIGPIVRHFIESGGTVGDQSCVRNIRPIRTVPAFATKYADVAPASPAAGNRTDETGLRLASAAAETVGDVIARYYVNDEGSGSGLRGGTFDFDNTDTGYEFDLDDLQWTRDLKVSGKIEWNQLSGEIAAKIRFTAKGHSGKLTIVWNDRETEAIATLSGDIDGKRLEAERLAP